MKLETPLTEEGIRGLRVKDKVLLSGTIVTARDEAHRYLLEHQPADLPFSLEGGVIYHCGPVVEGKKIVAAGPTTSIREEPYQSEVIERYGVKAVIGKGGMGEETLNALQENAAVYLSAVGGAAALIADCIKETQDVYMLEEFGVPEAFWILKVKDLPLIVSMDSHGESLYRDVEEGSRLKLEEILKN